MIQRTGTEAELQLVVFSIGTEEFGVEIKSIQEIIRMIHITVVPRAPKYIKGMINLRGKIITVIDLNVIMGLKSSENSINTRIIIANIDGTVMGFIVDSVTEVLRIPEKNIEQAPSIIKDRIHTEYINGVGKIDDRLLVILDLNRMLSPDELARIHDMTAEGKEAA